MPLPSLFPVNSCRVKPGVSKMQWAAVSSRRGVISVAVQRAPRGPMNESSDMIAGSPVMGVPAMMGWLSGAGVWTAGSPTEHPAASQARNSRGVRTKAMRRMGLAPPAPPRCRAARMLAGIAVAIYVAGSACGGAGSAGDAGIDAGDGGANACVRTGPRTVRGLSGGSTFSLAALENGDALLWGGVLSYMGADGKPRQKLVPPLRHRHRVPQDGRGRRRLVSRVRPHRRTVTCAAGGATTTDSWASPPAPPRSFNPRRRPTWVLAGPPWRSQPVISRPAPGWTTASCAASAAACWTARTATS